MTTIVPQDLRAPPGRTSTLDELRAFWEVFDVHRLQLRMALREALGTARLGLPVLAMIVPDPTSQEGLTLALHQRDAWLDGRWETLSAAIELAVEQLVADGLLWNEWLALLRPIRDVLLRRICEGSAYAPHATRAAIHGMAHVLDHLTTFVGAALTRATTPDAPAVAVENRRTTSDETILLALDAAPVAFVAVQEDGIIAASNRELEALLGYGRGDLVGKPLEVLVPVQSQQRHQKLRGRYRSMPTARRMGAGKEIRAVRKDGSEVQVEIGLTPFQTADGDLVLASMFELSADRSDESRLRRTLAELQRSNEELEQFASVVSHDLQEPLRMVSSYTELLRRQYHDRLDDDANLYIDYAVDGAQRLSRVVQELLTYSRVGSQRGSFVPTATRALLQGVLDDLQLAIMERQAQIFVPDELPTIVADSSQLRLVFQNLIGNAIKFARPGVAPRVEISAERNGEQWVFAIEDNGKGIEPRFVERIFGLFQRLHSRDEYEGSGIGLTMARRIVDRHGGRVWVESTPGQGSTFYFALPLWPVTIA